MSVISRDSIDQLLRILECARDLRINFSCDAIISDYVDSRSFKDIVESLDLTTLPDEWEGYEESKKQVFQDEPDKIIKYALRGWTSTNKQIGSMESIVQEHTGEQPYEIIVKESGQLFPFIDNANAELLYKMTKEDRYTNKGTLMASKIVEDFEKESGIKLHYRYVNVIVKKYKFLAQQG